MNTEIRFYTPTNIRLATAIEFKDGGVLEVYPTRTYFENRSTWESKFSKMTGFFQEGEKLQEKTLPHKRFEVCKEKPSPDTPTNTNPHLTTTKRQQRLKWEMEMFVSPTYKDMFTNIVYTGDDTVEVTFNSDRWRIKRCLNFLGKPPQLWCNGEYQHWDSDDWSPAFTCATFLLAYATSKEELIAKA